MHRQGGQKLRPVIFLHQCFKSFQIFSQQIHRAQILQSGRIGRSFFQEKFQVSRQSVYHGQRIPIGQHPPAGSQYGIVFDSFVLIKEFALWAGPIPVCVRFLKYRDIFFSYRVSAVNQIRLHQSFQHTRITILHGAHITFKSHFLRRSGRSHRKIDIAEQARDIFRFIPLHKQPLRSSLVEVEHFIREFSLIGQCHIQMAHI